MSLCALTGRRKHASLHEAADAVWNPEIDPTRVKAWRCDECDWFHGALGPAKPKTGRPKKVRAG